MISVLLLDGNELNLYTVGINTNRLHLGELALRVEGNAEFGMFRSVYSDTYVVEGGAEGDGGTRKSGNQCISAFAN